MHVFLKKNCLTEIHMVLQKYLYYKVQNSTSEYKSVLMILILITNKYCVGRDNENPFLETTKKNSVYDKKERSNWS